jgi:hypothetical protein
LPRGLGSQRALMPLAPHGSSPLRLRHRREASAPDYRPPQLLPVTLFILECFFFRRGFILVSTFAHLRRVCCPVQSADRPFVGGSVLLSQPVKHCFCFFGCSSPLCPAVAPAGAAARRWCLFSVGLHVSPSCERGCVSLRHARCRARRGPVGPDDRSTWHMRRGHRCAIATFKRLWLATQRRVRRGAGAPGVQC